ncbi:MAG: radical SAM protein [Nitrospirota bacterium]|nr:radical SAM protein [Nitrospirota bacterium]
MKCYLIVPAWIPDEIFSAKTAGSQINYWQPLGMLYIASALMKAGHEVRFLNGAFMTNADIIKEVEKDKPEVVGLYSTTFGWKKAKEASKALKAIDKNIFVCVGGPYPIAVKEKCIEDCETIDAVVTGEGEFTMLEILDRISAGKNLDGVLGAIYREGGEVKINPPRPFIDDLDSLPFPARELLGDAVSYIPPPATYKRKPVAVMITSRGCNRRCIFCFQMDKTRKSGVRYRSVDNVMEEIELCLKQGYREIKFIDDTLAANYDRAMKIAKEIKARKLDFTWFASACVSQVDKPLLQAFKDAGCWAILFGAESGVQKDLNSIKKGITLDQTRKAVKTAKEVGLKVLTPFLFGIPGQTFEDGLKSIEFACEIDPDVANFHALTPFPGSELYDNIEKYGTMSDDTTDYTYQGAAFTPYSLTREEIWKLRQIAFKKFYSRPKYIAGRIIRMRTVDDLKAALKGAKSLFWLWVQGDIFRRDKKST